MRAMKERISDYRDHQISHLQMPDALRGMSGKTGDPYVHLAGGGWFAGSKNAPKTEEEWLRQEKLLTSETPVTMLPAVREYFQLWLRYVEAHASRCRWRKDQG